MNRTLRFVLAALVVAGAVAPAAATAAAGGSPAPENPAAPANPALFDFERDAAAGRIDHALARADAAVATRADDLDLALRRARLYALYGAPAAALTALDDLIAREPHLAPAYIEKGLLLVRLGRLREGGALVLGTLSPPAPGAAWIGAVGDGYDDPRLRLVRTLHDTGTEAGRTVADDLLSAFERARPGDPAGPVTRADITNPRDHEARTRLLKRAHALAPGDATIAFRLGHELHQQMRVIEALPLLEQTALIDPLRRHLAGALAATVVDLPPPLRERARRRFAGHVRHRPSPPFVFVLGVLDYYDGRYGDARHAFNAVRDRYPDEVRVPMYAAMAAFHAGDQATAEREIDALVRRDAIDDPDVWYCEGQIFAATNRLRAAAALHRFLDEAAKEPVERMPAKIERVRDHLRALERRIALTRSWPVAALAASAVVAFVGLAALVRRAHEA